MATLRGPLGEPQASGREAVSALVHLCESVTVVPWLDGTQWPLSRPAMFRSGGFVVCRVRPSDF
jgi:hypothetical protein